MGRGFVNLCCFKVVLAFGRVESVALSKLWSQTILRAQHSHLSV